MFSSITDGTGKLCSEGLAAHKKQARPGLFKEERYCVSVNFLDEDLIGEGAGGRIALCAPPLPHLSCSCLSYHNACCKISVFSVSSMFPFLLKLAFSSRCCRLLCFIRRISSNISTTKRSVPTVVNGTFLCGAWHIPYVCD